MPLVGEPPLSILARERDIIPATGMFSLFSPPYAFAFEEMEFAFDGSDVGEESRNIESLRAEDLDLDSTDAEPFLAAAVVDLRRRGIAEADGVAAGRAGGGWRCRTEAGFVGDMLSCRCFVKAMRWRKSEACWSRKRCVGGWKTRRLSVSTVGMEVRSRRS